LVSLILTESTASAPNLTGNVRDGNDGSWSSFAVQIGTPPQVVRVLPDIAGNSIWTVLAQACDTSEANDCPSSRGNVFNSNQSTTWKDKGLYELPLNPEHFLPYSGNADFGLDTVTLDWQGHGGPSLSNQVIGGFVAEDIYIGVLGLSPATFNITSLNNPLPSVLGSLNEQNIIPSSSWAYLAGASYYSYPHSAYGSLTFGGYDSTRFDNRTNLTLAGGSDQYRPFLLGIESITSGSDFLLSEPIIAALDTITAHIWLPISVCQAFESAFGLVWNETYSLYILDDDQHATLLKRNPSVTFTLSTGNDNSADRLNITLPYGAFDLLASPPLAGNDTSHYFPLQRAANESQYTLGRTFFQEAYMIADYDHGQVMVFPGVYPNSSVLADIVSICHPNATVCNGISTLPGNQGHGLGGGAIAGIVIGIVATIGLVGLGIILTVRARRRRKARQSTSRPKQEPDELVKPELDATQMYKGHEIDGSCVHDSMLGLDSETGSTGLSLKVSPRSPQRWSNSAGMSSESGGLTRFEMPGHVDTPELEGSHQLYEMPA
jgi:hypothetical protein